MTMEVMPTVHFVRRCSERLGNLSPPLQVGKSTLMTGVLVLERRRNRPMQFYLDVDGLGRVVLVHAVDGYVAVTYLPRIYSHEAPTGGYHNRESPMLGYVRQWEPWKKDPTHSQLSNQKRW